MSDARYGLTVPVGGVPLHEQRPVFEELEALGYTDVWTAEGGGMDGLTPLTLAAAWTSKLRLGAGVVSSFTRGPGILAMTAAGMANAAPGRFVLGIGSSSDIIVRNWNGIPFDKPYSRTRDVARFLKAAFTGESVTEQYETFAVKSFRLPKLESPPKVVIAAARERMLRLAASESDGAMINLCSAADVVRIAAIVHEENPDAEIIDRIMVCPTDDTEAVYRAVKPTLAAYTSVGVYRAYHEWLGRSDVLGETWAAWAAGDRAAAVAAVPDSVVDELCVHGTPEQCREHLARFVENGVTTPVLAIMNIGGDTREAIRALAPDA
ncbi:MAG: LLM class F420-dependent oxidoreductase [Acidimicrobiia bacterium]